MRTAHRFAPHTTRGLASWGVLVALTASTTLTGCSTGDTGAAASTPAEVTVTSTTSAPVTSTAAADGATTTSSTTPRAAAGGTTAAAGRDQTASGLPTCQPSQMTVRVDPSGDGAAAGHTVVTLLATNSGTTQCVTQGYPGVSLVAPGTGQQIGAAADREPLDPGTTAPLMRLEPGKTAVTQVQVAQALNYGDTCKATKAAGFRVYLPGTTAAAFAPYEVTACATPSVHLLQVQPFTS